MRQRFAAPFLEPVPEQAAPGYYAIIKQPQDLTSIVHGLESNAYPSLGHPLHIFELVSAFVLNICRFRRLKGHTHHESEAGAPVASVPREY